MDSAELIELIDQAIPQAARQDIERYAPWIAQGWAAHHIDTPYRRSAWLAQVAVESNYLRTIKENLNYSAAGLANTWPKRYSITGRAGGAPNQLAMSIARDPVKIANNTYANRMGNGSPESGDGWKYIGRGLKQLTGKDNYAWYRSWSGADVVSRPDLLLEPEHAVGSAIGFWVRERLNSLADATQHDPNAFHIISALVSCGSRHCSPIGKEHRFEAWRHARRACRAHR
jgi:putative chitinase